MSHTYRFVETAATSPKTRWSIEAKAFAIKTKSDGNTAVQAFEMTAEQFGLELKPSYTHNAGAHTHLARFRRELKQAVANPGHNNHQSALEACAALGLFNDESAES